MTRRLRNLTLVVALSILAGCQMPAIEPSSYQQALGAYYAELDHPDRTFATALEAVDAAVDANPGNPATYLLRAQIHLDLYRLTRSADAREQIVVALQAAAAAIPEASELLDWVPPRLYILLGDLMLVESQWVDPVENANTDSELQQLAWKAWALANSAGKYYLLAAVLAEQGVPAGEGEVPPPSAGLRRERQHAREGLLQARMAQLAALDAVDNSDLLGEPSGFPLVRAQRVTILQALKSVAIQGSTSSDLVGQPQATQLEATLRRIDSTFQHQIANIFYRSGNEEMLAIAAQCKARAAGGEIDETEFAASGNALRAMLLEAASHRVVGLQLEVAGEDTTVFQVPELEQILVDLDGAFRRADFICLTE